MKSRPQRPARIVDSRPSRAGRDIPDWAQLHQLWYWIDDDNLVYSAALKMTAGQKEMLLFRENISGVDLIRDCEEVLATGTVRVRGTQGTLVTFMARHVSSST